jgi:hypothetical protein
VKRRVERAFFYAQETLRGTLDVQRDAEAVIGSYGERLDDEQVKRALRGGG